MTSRFFSRQMCLVIALAFLGLTGWSAIAPPPVEDFSVIQFTDTHINPHLTRFGPPGEARGADTLAWICQQAGLPQELPNGDKLPPPALAICTGDATEYGVIDDTWDIFENSLKDLPCPMYVVAGNHDNTWGALYAVMRKLYGGENYSFDHGGVHFACISSSSPQEPVPTIDAKTRAWLKGDLDALPPNTPIVLSLHHPIYSNEFANPAAYDTFIDLLRDYNVILMLYGHGHSVNHRLIGGIHGVMGGETWRKNMGYGVLSFKDGMVRYDYHYHKRTDAKEGEDSGPYWQGVCEFRLPTKAPVRLLDFESPAPEFIATGDKLNVRLTTRAVGGRETPDQIKLCIDGEDAATIDVDSRELAAEVPVGTLTPGAHLLTATLQRGDDMRDLRTRIFYVTSPDIEVVWNRKLDVAVKAGPVLFDGLLIVADNAGVVSALNPATGEQRWTCATGGEILGTPIVAHNLLICGSGDGKVYALDQAGKPKWSYDAKQPVYGWPVADDDTVYVGDSGGRLHALNVADGKPRWVYERADFTIEAAAVIWNDVVVFGDWDGYLYAISRKDGTLAWKAPGPMVSTGKSRYYAPADCGPITLGDRMIVCDRGYMVGAYSPAGEVLATWETQVAGISPAADRKSYYARCTSNAVRRYAVDGTAIWETEVPAGRFPIPPTEHDGKLYICSNTGQLTALDAGSGQKLWSYQITPGFYVMAPVTVIDQGAKHPVCVIAGMDGTLTAIRHR